MDYKDKLPEGYTPPPPRAYCTHDKLVRWGKYFICEPRGDIYCDYVFSTPSLADPNMRAKLIEERNVEEE